MKQLISIITLTFFLTSCSSNEDMNVIFSKRLKNDKKIEVCSLKDFSNKYSGVKSIKEKGDECWVQFYGEQDEFLGKLK